MSRNRTEPSEEFATGGVPVARFQPVMTVAERPTALDWANEQIAESNRHEFTPLAQVSQIWLGDRDIDFVRDGPLLGINKRKELVIATPIFSLPPRLVRVNRHGKPLWNIEKLDENKRKWALANSEVKPMRLHIEAYAEAGKYQGFYVLQPLTQMLCTTVDPSRHKIYVNFFPGENGNYPVLFYDPGSHRLMIWGGGGYSLA